MSLKKLGTLTRIPENKDRGQKLTDRTLLEVFSGSTVDKNPPAGHTDLIPGPG